MNFAYFTYFCILRVFYAFLYFYVSRECVKIHSLNITDTSINSLYFSGLLMNKFLEIKEFWTEYLSYKKYIMNILTARQAIKINMLRESVTLQYVDEMYKCIKYLNIGISITLTIRIIIKDSLIYY